MKYKYNAFRQTKTYQICTRKHINYTNKMIATINYYREK